MRGFIHRDVKAGQHPLRRVRPRLPERLRALPLEPGRAEQPDDRGRHSRRDSELRGRRKSSWARNTCRTCRPVFPGRWSAEALTGVVPLEGPQPSATMVNQTSKMLPAPRRTTPPSPPSGCGSSSARRRKGRLGCYPNCMEFSNAFLEAAGITSAGSGAQKRSGERAAAGPTPAPPSKAPGRPPQPSSTVTAPETLTSRRRSSDTPSRRPPRSRRMGTRELPQGARTSRKLRHAHAGQEGQCVMSRPPGHQPRDLTGGQARRHQPAGRPVQSSASPTSPCGWGRSCLAGSCH